MKQNKSQPNLDFESKLSNLDKLINNFDLCLSYIISSQNEREIFSQEVKREYKRLLFIRDIVLGQSNSNKMNNPTLEFLRKNLESKVEKFKGVLLEKIQKMGLAQKIIEDKTKILDIKQMLQNFLAKANEIAGMESTIMSSKKKNKTEKSEKSLLLEKIEMLKKKLESDIIFSFMTSEQNNALRIFLEKMIAEIENPQLITEFEKVFDFLEENFNVLLWDQTKKYKIEQEEINFIIGMIDSKIPINALDLEGKKGDRKQNFNNNEFKREESALMKMLETSFMNMPEASDYFPTETGKETNYPKSLFPKRRYINEKSFEKMDIETLFFIFYFQKGTYEQLLAARQLKSLSWRYHKKYLTWFKRMEEPRESTEEFEKGTYAFFDHEKGWTQRRKNDFTFKYQYLEDE